MVDFEPRRLIKFGNSSFIVSLPKEWITKNNLKKGDLLYIRENEDNQIVVLPKERKNFAEEERKIEISITDKDIDSIKREITAAYIANYKLITITGKEMKENSSQIKEILQPLTGMEIIEQNPKEIIAKDFLNIETIAPRKIIRRLDNSIRSIFEDLRTGLKDAQFRPGQLNEILEEDKNINKMYLLILKLTKIGLKNQELMKIFDMSYEELSSAQWLAMNLEYLGDDLKRIARFLTKAKLNPKQKEYLESTCELIEKCFADAMTSYHKGDPGLAREVLRKKQTILKEIDRLCQFKDDVLAGNIAERLKMVYAHIYNISKLIIY
jgi:phosphate uptake regulator